MLDRLSTTSEHSLPGSPSSLSRGPRLPSKPTSFIARPTSTRRDRRGRGRFSPTSYKLALQATLPTWRGAPPDPPCVFLQVRPRRRGDQLVSPACRSPKNRPIRSRTHTSYTGSPACRRSRRDPLQWHAPPPNRLLRRAGLRRSPRRYRRRPEEEVGAAAATARPLSRGKPHAWESSPATET